MFNQTVYNMAKFIKLHEKKGEEVYLNIDHIAVVQTHTYRTEDGGSVKVTQIMADHCFVEVEESKQGVMGLIRMADRRFPGEFNR